MEGSSNWTAFPCAAVRQAVALCGGILGTAGARPFNLCSALPGDAPPLLTVHSQSPCYCFIFVALVIARLHATFVAAHSRQNTRRRYVAVTKYIRSDVSGFLTLNQLLNKFRAETKATTSPVQPHNFILCLLTHTLHQFLQTAC